MTLKNFIEVRQMTLNDPKFDIKTPCKPSPYCEYGMLQLTGLLLYKLFSNFKPQKMQRTLFCCFGYQIRINKKIGDTVKLILIFTLSTSCYQLHVLVLLEIIDFSNKNRVNYGTKFRL